MTVFFTGLGSAAGRTLFTNRGPIVKKPIQLVGGANLFVTGPNRISVSTQPFLSSHVGKQLVISGTPSGRNDGTFYISRVISNSVVELDNANLNSTDEQETIDSLLVLTNELQYRYNQHRVSTSHVNSDIVNPANAGLAVDVVSVSIMLNGLLTAFSLHIGTVFSTGGPVHIEPDSQNLPQAIAAYNLPSAILLANDIRRKMELHRQNDIVHTSKDTLSRVSAPEVIPTTGTGPLVGPFAWIIQDPRIGQIADDPTDVVVRVNGNPVTVDSVFGLLGAVVLTNAPIHGDLVAIDYNFLDNPPTKFERLNTPEFVLNGDGNNGVVGLPGHTYRARSYLIDPESYTGTVESTVGSAFQPIQVGWKYKALERAYTAVLNDPNTLLLNVPGNRVAYPVFESSVEEVTIRYDPTSLPDISTDPWKLEGQGIIFIESGSSLLTVMDDDIQTGPYSNPPFYTHSLNIEFPSTISAAFRMSAETIQNDGAVVGPGFGFTDGSTLALVGLLETSANNLSSAIARANAIMEEFNSHLVTTGVHRPNSPQDSIDVVAATDQISLIILTNRLRALFNQHISRGSLGDGVVHVIADIVNTDLNSDATSIDSAIVVLNALANEFNAHRTQHGIHYVDDILNIVGFVKQIGLLIEAKLPELETSWISSAFDWTITSTYRLYKDENGVVSLYSGGDFTPLASAKISELPATSDVDLKIDSIQQTFFGSLSRQASSTSYWNFVRVNITPIDFNQIIGNKSVVYEPIDVPEKDPFAPWITVGQGGYDRIVSNKLVLDSTSSAPVGTESALGLSTGAYRGFLRLEPILQITTSSSIEFTTSVGFYTYSVSNRASGVFFDDGDLSVHMVFLQGSPIPSSITGVINEPFPILSGDTIILSIDGKIPQTLTFTFNVTDAFTASNVINSQLLFNLASAVDGKVRFTNQSLGSASSIQIIGGHAVEKLGIPVGTYFGRDSNPEPKVSWFGENYPDLEIAPWDYSGSQLARLYGRTLRITDSSSIDYRAYSFVDPLYLSVILSSDWKLDVRCSVLSCTPGNPIFAGSNLSPCGVLVNVDEGPLGKNVEFHLSQDSIGQQYVNILSFSSGLNSLVSVSEMPFAWNDEKVHSYNIYTSKTANLCIVLVDNIPIGTFAYSSLQTGVSGPAISFGSGSEQVSNADLRSSESVVDWSSVCVFRDSKISDPLAVSQRYIGLYKGGDPEVLSSYYLSQIDWTLTHTYRIVRDPTSSVSIYIDGSLVPSISVNYDVLTLPPVSSSFLKNITNSKHSIAFGSFNPFEIDRTVWGTVSYSIGKITITDQRVPGHQVLNYGNVVASPDHLFTKTKHSQFGFSIWSGGTPSDEFMYLDTEAYTILGDGTPPVPMTQDLESRGGLVKIDTPIMSIPSENLINSPGFIADLEDDSINVLTVIPFVKQLIDLVNEAVQKFNEHLTSYGVVSNSVVSVHLTSDTWNAIVAPPATDLASAISLLNILTSAYQAHLVQIVPFAVHTQNDTIDAPSLGFAIDAQSAYLVATELIQVMNQHFVRWVVHFQSDISNIITIPDPIDLATMILVLTSMKSLWNSHVGSVVYHKIPDPTSSVISSDPVDLSSCITTIDEMMVVTESHRLNSIVQSHPSWDFVNVPPSGITPNLPTALSNTILLKSFMNGHFSVNPVHQAQDMVDVITGPLQDPLYNTRDFSINLKSKFNAHLTQLRVHLNNDPGELVLLPDPPMSPPASTMSMLLGSVSILEAVKYSYNAHRTMTVSDSNSNVHTIHDVLNPITAPDYSTGDPFDVVANLCFDEWNKYSSHLVNPGSHGSSVLIRLDPPNRVLYEGMRFFIQSDGEQGLTSPFSDDENAQLSIVLS